MTTKIPTTLPPQLTAIGITRVIAFDFETYYNTEDKYSLAVKTPLMTTERYVRDDRFQVICVTATLDGDTVYSAWGHDDCRQLLLDLGVERKDTLCVAHNARFDGCIAEMRMGIRFNMLVCSMHLMRITGLSRITNESLSSLANFLRGKGYPLREKGHEVANANGLRLEAMTPAFKTRYMDYCRTDTLILYDAAMILMQDCPVDTLRASSMTLQMYTRPAIQLNKGILTNYLSALQIRRQETLAAMAKENGCEGVAEFMKLLRSKPRLAELLRSMGVEPPTKESEKQTETKRRNLLDPAWIAKRKTPKFLASLAAQGKTWEQWAEEPVVDYAFAAKDTEFMALAEHWNTKVSALVNARLENNSSIAESRTQRFLDCADRGLFVVALQYAKARTHRYGADDALNQQNLPKHSGDKTLRFSMEAPVGMEIGGADSSQIEARCLAYAAQETKLLNIFSTGGDPYSHMAEIIYNVPADEIRKWSKMDANGLTGDDKKKQAKLFNMRFIGKKVILGSGYQMGGNKFALTLRQEGITLKPTPDQVMKWLKAQSKTVVNNKRVLELEYNLFLEAFHLQEAKRFNWVYRQSHQRIKGFWDMCEWVLGKMCMGDAGYFGGPDGCLFYFDGQHQVFGEPTPGIMLPNGEWLIFPHLSTYIEEKTGFTKFMYKETIGRATVTKSIYGGSLTENIIQALAFAVLTWQAVRIHDVLPVKGNVHDEWFSVYPITMRDRVKAVYETAMKAVPPFVPGLPLNCEFSSGPSYGHM
jgi:DNA polymerase